MQIVRRELKRSLLIATVRVVAMVSLQGALSWFLRLLQAVAWSLVSRLQLRLVAQPLAHGIWSLLCGPILASKDHSNARGVKHAPVVDRFLSR